MMEPKDQISGYYIWQETTQEEGQVQRVSVTMLV